MEEEDGAATEHGAAATASARLLLCPGHGHECGHRQAPRASALCVGTSRGEGQCQGGGVAAPEALAGGCRAQPGEQSRSCPRGRKQVQEQGGVRSLPRGDGEVWAAGSWGVCGLAPPRQAAPVPPGAHAGCQPCAHRQALPNELLPRQAGPQAAPEGTDPLLHPAQPQPRWQAQPCARHNPCARLSSLAAQLLMALRAAVPRAATGTGVVLGACDDDNELSMAWGENRGHCHEAWPGVTLN